MRTHLAMHVEYLRARGLSEADAEVEAMRRFGDPEEYSAYTELRAARQARWRGIIEWLDEWTQDIRFANRQFRRNAAFTALAVLTLALGIGANTAIFTVVHRLLIAPLPYPDGNRIVKLVVTDGESVQSPNRALLQAWRDRAHSLELVAGISVDALYLQDFGDTRELRRDRGAGDRDSVPCVLDAGAEGGADRPDGGATQGLTPAQLAGFLTRIWAADALSWFPGAVYR